MSHLRPWNEVIKLRTAKNFDKALEKTQPSDLVRLSSQVLPQQHKIIMMVMRSRWKFLPFLNTCKVPGKVLHTSKTVRGSYYFLNLEMKKARALEQFSNLLQIT